MAFVLRLKRASDRTAVSKGFRTKANVLYTHAVLFSLLDWNSPGEATVTSPLCSFTTTGVTQRQSRDLINVVRLLSDHDSADDPGEGVKGHLRILRCRIVRCGLLV